MSRWSANTRLRRLGLLVALAMAGCAESGPVQQQIVLVTDLRPIQEFAAVESELIGPDAPAAQEHIVDSSRDYRAGAVIATFSPLPDGATYTAVVRLLDSDRTLVTERRVEFTASESGSFTVVVSRDCTECVDASIEVPDASVDGRDGGARDADPPDQGTASGDGSTDAPVAADAQVPTDAHVLADTARSPDATGPDAATGTGTALLVSRPIVARGPFGNELDTSFPVLRLSDNSFRGFSSNHDVYRIEATRLYDFNGPRMQVIGASPAGTLGESGRWMSGLVRLPGSTTILGFVHQEAGADYPNGQTHKSFGLFSSDDEGVSWTFSGTIVQGADDPMTGTITGTGDCRPVHHGGFIYLYCIRSEPPWRTVVARASYEDAATDQFGWRYFYEGDFSEPAIRGRSSELHSNFLGASAFYAETEGFAGLMIDREPGVAHPELDAQLASWLDDDNNMRQEEFLQLARSTDFTTFTLDASPLLLLGPNVRPRGGTTTTHGFSGIWGAVDPVNGGNNVGRVFELTYTHVFPGGRLADRYLVMRRIRMRERPTALAPSVLVELTRFVDADDEFVTTSEPQIDNALRSPETLGYWMTRPHATYPTQRIQLCQTTATRFLHSRDNDQGCGTNERVKTVGWLFTEDQTSNGIETVEFFRCRYANGKRFISTDSACEGETQEISLGYALVEY